MDGLGQSVRGRSDRSDRLERFFSRRPWNPSRHSCRQNWCGGLATSVVRSPHNKDKVDATAQALALSRKGLPQAPPPRIVIRSAAADLHSGEACCESRLNHRWERYAEIARCALRQKTRSPAHAHSALPDRPLSTPAPRSLTHSIYAGARELARGTAVLERVHRDSVVVSHP